MAPGAPRPLGDCVGKAAFEVVVGAEVASSARSTYSAEGTSVGRVLGAENGELVAEMDGVLMCTVGSRDGVESSSKTGVPTLFRVGMVEGRGVGCVRSNRTLKDTSVS